MAYCRPVMDFGGFRTPQHTFRESACSNAADPINIVCPEVSSVFLVDRLLGREPPGWGHRWTRTRLLASDQWIPGPPSRMQADQLVAGRLWNRFHVRIWNRSDEPARTVASAHQEHLFTLGVARKLHKGLHWPASFDTGRRAVQETIAGDDITIDSAPDLYPRQWDPGADGSAIVVRR